MRIITEDDKNNQQPMGRVPSSIIPSRSYSVIHQDSRKEFYKLEDIKNIYIGAELNLAPYDAMWYFEASDAKVLPFLTNTSKIKRYLPGLGFEDEVLARKRLESLLLKAENQLGITYVIRNKNIPIGMIFINTPLFNLKSLKLAIWTLDFYISEEMEHKGIMYNSLLRILNVMKINMGVEYVYALVDENNNDCRNLITSNMFTNIGHFGFTHNRGSNTPLFYMANLKIFEGNWIINSRNFTLVEQKAIMRAKVVDSEFGIRVCFYLRDGKLAFLPLSEKSESTIGDIVDLRQAKLLTLHKNWSDNVYQVEILSINAPHYKHSYNAFYFSNEILADEVNVLEKIKKHIKANGRIWEIVDSRNFTSEEQCAVLRAEVVASEYGKSVCFIMRSGGQTYIPLCEDTILCVGDTVDMTKAKILTLHRNYSADINRIDI